MQKDSVIVNETVRHLESSKKQSEKWMMLAIVLIIIGFVFQLVSTISTISIG